MWMFWVLLSWRWCSVDGQTRWRPTNGQTDHHLMTRQHDKLNKLMLIIHFKYFFSKWLRKKHQELKKQASFNADDCFSCLLTHRWRRPLWRWSQWRCTMAVCLQCRWSSCWSSGEEARSYTGSSSVFGESKKASEDSGGHDWTRRWRNCLRSRWTETGTFVFILVFFFLNAFWNLTTSASLVLL